MEAARLNPCYACVFGFDIKIRGKNGILFMLNNPILITMSEKYNVDSIGDMFWVVQSLYDDMLANYNDMTYHLEQANIDAEDMASNILHDMFIDENEPIEEFLLRLKDDEHALNAIRGIRVSYNEILSIVTEYIDYLDALYNTIKEA